MTDRTTKILLVAIAAGLWMNIFVPMLRPTEAIAQYEADHVLKIMDVRLEISMQILTSCKGALAQTANFAPSAINCD